MDGGEGHRRHGVPGLTGPARTRRTGRRRSSARSRCRSGRAAWPSSAPAVSPRSRCSPGSATGPSARRAGPAARSSSSASRVTPKCRTPRCSSDSTWSGKLLQRELEAVEPDVDEHRVLAPDLAAEHIDVERACSRRDHGRATRDAGSAACRPSQHSGRANRGRSFAAVSPRGRSARRGSSSPGRRRAISRSVAVLANPSEPHTYATAAGSSASGRSAALEPARRTRRRRAGSCGCR